MKRVAILATTGAVLISAGLLIPKVAFADEDLVRGDFIERMSEKLGLSEDVVEDAILEVRVEEREKRDAERNDIITSALADGDLTERQVEIMDAIFENRPEPGEGRRMSGEGESGAMVDILNEQGLDITEEELSELKAVREDLGLKGGPGEGRGQGHMMRDAK